MDKIKALYQKYKELILYIVFGILTTAVNLIIYFLLSKVIGESNYIISNTVAWIGAVLFAYITNRTMVFNSQAKDKKSVIKEILSFYGARVFSLVVENMLFYVFVELLYINNNITKLVLQILVIILNYIFSKFIVFRKKKNNK